MAQLIACLLALLALSARAADQPPTLSTSGQPSADWLHALKTQGYEAVVYLAPSTVSDAVREEPQIVTSQGLAFHHIPIPFGTPKPAHYEEFARLMRTTLAGKKVLVHCQVNMRASTLIFLYRVLVLKTPPEQAYEAVSRVWTPGDAWKTLMLAELRKNGINFDPF